MPSAEISKPPHQHTADTTPALRGPTRSSQPPHMAADAPRKTKNSVNIQPRLDTRQSQVVVNSSAISETSAPQVSGLVMPSARPSGSQKTEKP
jgi:hypothetical protein